MTASMIQPGALDQRLRLQAPNEADDGAGGVIRSYTHVTTLWAQVIPEAMRADMSADHLGASLRYRIVIRKRHDVTLRHRFQENSAFYRIIAMRESADRCFLEIDAEVQDA
jgi:SPP1 family predicted phage head-tail adaptor